MMSSSSTQPPEPALVQELMPDPTRMPTSFWARNWQKLMAVAIWVVLIGGLVAYVNLNNLTIGDALTNIVRLMQTPYGPLIYLLIYAVRPLAFFSATVLTLAAGSIFGPFWGVIFTILAANTSATVAYFLGRFLGTGVLDESQTTGVIHNYATRMRRNSFETILIMRFVFLPYDLVNYLAGFLRIDYKAFILATIIGSLPGTITFVLAGASVDINEVLMGQVNASVFNPWALAVSVLLFVSSLALSRYFKQRESRRNLAN